MSLYSPTPASQTANDYVGHATLARAAIGDNLSFQLLYHNYQPLIKKVWRSCPVDGLEYDDWCQEAQVIILKILTHHDLADGAQFGWLLKQSLIHRIFDLYRQRHAKKRIPKEAMTSLDDLATVVMVRSHDPSLESIVETKNGLRDFWQICSPFERQVFKGIHCGQTPIELAHRYHCQPAAINSAMSRCRRKLKMILQ